MKRPLLVFAALSTFITVNAQYVKTSASAPKAGDVFSQAIDTLPQVTKGGAGANQVWDLSNFDLDDDFEERYEDPSLSTVADQFPEADVILPAGFETRFFDVTTSGMKWVGVSIPNFETGEEVGARLNPEEIMFEFPAEYGDAYPSSSNYRAAFKFDSTITQDGTTYDIDSMRFSYSSDKVVEWDAWGRLTTPYGTFSNTLRERVYQEIQYMFEVCLHIPVIGGCSWVDVSDISGFGIKDTMVIYSWYGEASGFPLASIGYDGTDTDVEFASVNTAVEGDGIAEGLVRKGHIYPNPAFDRIFLKDAITGEITITDITGRVVMQEKVDGARELSISQLDAGNYMMTIVSRDGISKEKLSVAK